MSIFANDPAGRAAVARARQANRLAATASKPARKAIERVVDALDRQVASLDKQIRALVDADDGSRHLDGLLQSVPRRRPAQPRLGKATGKRSIADRLRGPGTSSTSSRNWQRTLDL